jgi:hypothetical protein
MTINQKFIKQLVQSLISGMLAAIMNNRLSSFSGRIGLVLFPTEKGKSSAAMSGRNIMSGWWVTPTIGNISS